MAALQSREGKPLQPVPLTSLGHGEFFCGFASRCLGPVRHSHSTPLVLTVTLTFRRAD
jgi:hypothetical protein